MGEDDGENISSFLKMLESQKDLLSPSTTTAVEANTKRTAAALNRFHPDAGIKHCLVGLYVLLNDDAEIIYFLEPSTLWCSTNGSRDVTLDLLISRKANLTPHSSYTIRSIPT